MLKKLLQKAEVKIQEEIKRAANHRSPEGG